jgi:hypothetical protein
MPAELREAMQCLADDAAKVLEKCSASDDERVRLVAAAQIFDRGYGSRISQHRRARGGRSLFLGRSAKAMPLSVSTMWIL